METAYLSSTEQALAHFQVIESQGLSDPQVHKALEKYGRNGTVHTGGSSIKRSKRLNYSV